MAALLAGSLTLLLAACGSSSSSPPPPPVAPAITTQPASQAVAFGAPATFTVVASGSAPLAYQWSRNGAAIAAATSPSYAIAAAGLDDDASYTVTVSNGTAPAAVSAAATLTVTPPSGVTFDASAQVVTPGEGVILTYTFPGTGTLDGAAASSGATTVAYPNATTTYTLGWNDGAAHSATRRVVVKGYTPKHLYVVNGGSATFDNGDGTFTTISGSNTLSHFAVNMLSGGNPVSPMIGAGLPTGQDPVHVVTAPGEKLLYVANRGSASVSGYALDPVSGAATQLAGSPFPLGGDVSPFALAFAPSGKFLYVACQDSIQVFAVAATGALADAPTLAVAIAGRTTGDLLMHPSGRFLYAADQGNGLVRPYAVDRATGALTALTAVTSAGGPVGMTFDRAATHLVARGSAADPANNAALNVFALDAYSGAATLTQQFEGFDAVNLNMPFVRGTDAGHHALAFSRQPGLDIIYDAYKDENVWPSSMSAYWLDVSSGAIPATGWDVGRGPVPAVPNTTWMGPVYTDFWGSAGDSVILDRSGTIQILTGAQAVGSFKIYPVTPDGSLTGSMMGDYDMSSSQQAYDGFGDFPSHAVFTGTLQ